MVNQDVKAEAKQIERLAFESLGGNKDSANNLALEVHTILSSPNRTYIDQLNEQLRRDKETNGEGMPAVTIVKDQQMKVEGRPGDDQYFSAKGVFSASVTDKLFDSAVNHEIGDKSKPELPEFLQAHKQSDDVVKLASSLEKIAKQSINGDIEAADGLAEQIKALGGNTEMISKLNEQFAYDDGHGDAASSALPHLHFVDADPFRRYDRSRLEVINDQDPKDKQTFFFDGHFGVSWNDKLGPALIERRSHQP